MPDTATLSRPKRGPRRARFEPKANPDPIRLTERDIAIARAIASNRVLNSHQVWETVGCGIQLERELARDAADDCTRMLLVRMLILGYVFAIRSVRALCREVHATSPSAGFAG